MNTLFQPRKSMDLSGLEQPILLVVIDTEEEFDWSRPFDRNEESVANIEQQHRAQNIFRQFNLMPIYIVDFPVANQESSIAVLKEFHENGECEIGAHLQPWVTPPFVEEVNSFNSFPGNLNYDAEYQKLKLLTETIEKNFNYKPIVYKAGRYGIGKNTASILEELSYKLDASVVPYTDFSSFGGPNFNSFSPQPFFFGKKNSLLEVPLSVDFSGILSGFPGGKSARLYDFIQNPLFRAVKVPGILSRMGILDRIRLSPEGHTLDEMKRLTRSMLKSGYKIYSMTYHSSSLLPGKTDYVSSDSDLEQFLGTIEGYIDFFFNEVKGKSIPVTNLLKTDTWLR